MTHADVKLLECVEVYVLLHWSSHVRGSLIGLLRVLKLLELSVDGIVLNLLEEESRCAELVSGLEQFGAAELCPVCILDVKHLTELGRAEREERLKGNLEVGNELERDIEDGLHALHVGLGHVPRLAVGNVFVADAGEVHSLLLCVAELEGVEQRLHLLLHVLKLLDCSAVYILQLATLGHDAVEVFLCELEGTVDEVAVNGYKLVVVAVLEVLPSEVVVLCLGSVGCEHVAQHVLLAGEINEIFVEPYSPVA